MLWSKMSFTSLSFYVFLPLVFAGYWLICYPKARESIPNLRLGLQNLFVVIASYIFYGWWDWRFLILMTITAVWAWASGLCLVQFSGVRRRKLVIVVALVVNLGILGVFKYYNFFMDGAVSILGIFGLSVHVSSLKIILPVGISFYTFQALSYVIDVYRGNIKPTKDIIAFLAFVSFFPQLVAGPIERATNLLPQFLKARHFDYPLAVDGCRQMLWGFFKKIVVADGCAVIADRLLQQSSGASSVSLLVGLVCFSFQIYGDFSGYSDIAIGLAKLFAIRLNKNFATPYFSRNIGEFWRRWHISLTTWFKDYLYIPLGGSREGMAKAIRNTYIIFAVSGLWHGANLTFVVWGIVHATAFLPLLLMKSNRKFAGTIVAESRVLPSVRELMGMTVTFIIVMLAWAFFRANSLAEAYSWLSTIIAGFDFSLKPLAGVGCPHMMFWLLIMIVCEWFNRKMAYGFAIYPESVWLRRSLYHVILFVIIVNMSAGKTFIYFQF